MSYIDKIAATAGGDVSVNPKRRFETPHALMTAESLSDEEKHSMLLSWEEDTVGQMRAIEEGMVEAQPGEAAREAKLADEATTLRTCLTDLEERLSI